MANPLNCECRLAWVVDGLILTGLAAVDDSESQQDESVISYGLGSTVWGTCRSVDREVKVEVVDGLEIQIEGQLISIGNVVNYRRKNCATSIWQECTA